MVDDKLRVLGDMSPFTDAADLGRRAQATDHDHYRRRRYRGYYISGMTFWFRSALAVLLSFGFDSRHRRNWRVSTSAASRQVLVAVAVAFAILIGLGANHRRQVAQLGANLPQYQIVVAKKWEAVQDSGFGKGVVEKAADTLHGRTATLGKIIDVYRNSDAPPANRRGPRDKSSLMQVEVHEPAPGTRADSSKAFCPRCCRLSPRRRSSIIFVIFILLQRGDLREPVIGLIGSHDLHRTTKALDDAAFRLSRYFLALTGINRASASQSAIGLSLIGVPNPILWASWAAVLKIVPYIGAFIAAALPSLSPPRSIRLEHGRRDGSAVCRPRGDSWGRSSSLSSSATRRACRRLRSSSRPHFWTLNLGTAGPASLGRHYGLPRRASGAMSKA